MALEKSSFSRCPNVKKINEKTPQLVATDCHCRNGDWRSGFINV